MRKATVLVSVLLTVCLVGFVGCGRKAPVRTGTSAVDEAMTALSMGRQDQAEQILSAAMRQETKNQRAAFFLGVCARSRWMKRDAMPIFGYVVTLNPETAEGKCATAMLALDGEEIYNKDNFDMLEKLHEDNPKDPLLLWMVAIACRELGKRGAPKSYSEKGAAYYGELLTILDPGPVLLHQTLANILSEELGRHEEALKHREIALRLEPASWSHQGMGNTLTYLKRYEEADVHFEKSTQMAPDDPTYLLSWASSLAARLDYPRAYGLYKRATEVAPDYPKAWSGLAWCAEKMNRGVEAKTYYEKAEKLKRQQGRQP